MWYLIRRVIPAVMFASGWGASLATEPDPEIVARLVHERHFEHPPLEEIPTADLQGLSDYLRSLAPWSRLLSPQQGANIGRTHDRYHEGIGATYFKRAEGILLVPLPNGPLSRSGVREPVRLLAADDIPATGAWREEALARIAAGTGSIKLTLLKSASDDQRRILQVPRARFRMVSAAVTHHESWPILRIYRFVASHTESLMRRQLNALAAVSPGKRSPLVIDLRYTTGGDLLEAAAAADLLLPEARRIYAIRSVVDGTADWIKATAQQLQGFSASQTVLLLGPETASAAEVFARALIAAGAVSIGLPTVGKCIGQEVTSLVENWTLLLSTAQILDPDRLYCDGEGIKPNHILDAEQENLDDTRLLLARIAPDYPALQMALEKAGLKKGREARASRISGIVPPTILSSPRPPVQDELSPGPTGSSAPPPSSKDPVRHPVSYVCRREPGPKRIKIWSA